MVKKDSIEFLNDILNSLTDKHKSILEISKDAGTSWESTKNALERLAELGIVIKEKLGERDYFLINPNPQPKLVDNIKYDTYFNLPINENERKKTYSYFSLIKDLWIKETGKNPTITQVYKVLAKLNHDLSLGLPIGWYLYGLNSVIIYSSEETYLKTMEINSDIESRVTSIIQKYKVFPKIRDLKKEQYKEFNKQSYITKEDILDNFYYDSEFISSSLLDNLKKLISHLYKDNINIDIMQYLNDFLGLMFEFKTYDKNLVLEAKEEIIDTFKELWKLTAMNYYKNDLKTRYEQEILDSCFDFEIKKQKEILNNNLSMLNEIIEVMNNKCDITNPDLKKLQGSVKETKDNVDYDSLAKDGLKDSKLFREFNLD